MGCQYACDVNTRVMPILAVCDMARELFCGGAGLEAGKLVCDSLVGGWWKAGNPGAVGLRRLQAGGRTHGRLTWQQGREDSHAAYVQMQGMRASFPCATTDKNGIRFCR